jgi:carboxypeptidase Taq
VQAITSSPRQPDTSFLRGFPVADQEAFLREVVAALGFDRARGRIDVAVHPFCGGHPDDCRITTRYKVDDPLDSLSGAMHETGHALYEQGLPAVWRDTPLGHAAGMAAHESQSRLWENQVGRSRAFWQYWEPRYRARFPQQLRDVDSEALYRALNRVALTPIRVDADEVTYNLHIMLRFELERRLFSGDLAPADLPAAWNSLSAEILGFTPPSNRVGCLQDVHWSGGAFGYFPSYCLGNLFAAQLWYAVRDALPDLDKHIAAGDNAPLLAWLRANIHCHGRRYTSRELVRVVTGAELSPAPLVRYLRERYLPLYS